MLLALHILLDTLAPAENAPSVRILLNAITRDPLLCILIAAALTWAAHSSVATVLLIMSLAYSHFVTPAAALALVLGANLGSAINPVLEGGHRDDPASYRLPVGNLLNRLVGIAIVAPFLRPITDVLRAVQPDMAKMTAEFHIAFNVTLAAVFIGALDPLAWLLERVFPARRPAADPSAPRYLDERLLEAPSLALADASRETLRMGDVVEVMLQQETLETTSLHLDVLRDLKRIHSHICSVAYSVLDAAGEMPAAEVAESDPITLSAPNMLAASNTKTRAR
jgi:phosphate:Na+ symporter